MSADRTGVPRRPPSGGMSSRIAGFTLIELMVVMLLIGLAMTYGLLHMDIFVPGARLEEGARDIGSLLARLRGVAVFTGQSVYLEYDLDQQRYRILRPTSQQEQDNGAPQYLEGEWHELPSHVAFEDVQLSDQDVVQNGTVQVEFTPTGEVTGHLVHLISDQIVDEVKKRYTVELNPITGIVTYAPGMKKYEQIQDGYAFQ